MHCTPVKNSTNMGIKRNPKVKYVKAEVFRKHEKLREQEFEDKICQLVNFNNNNNEHIGEGSDNVNANSNFQRNLLENSKGIESLEDDDQEEDKPPRNEDFTIAQHYWSFDEGEYLDSIYSSMKGDSISEDFNFEVVGKKIEIPPKLGVEHLASSNTITQINNASLMGSKITIGEPSGDVFGLVLENQYAGIFGGDYDHEFQPINTLHTE
jgi:hypothetical protein